MSKYDKDSPEYKAYQIKMKKREQERDIFYKRLQQECPIFWRQLRPVAYYAKPSVDSGWFDIVLECSQKVEKLIEPLQTLYSADMMPFPSQIKEKFGTLRFYYDFPEEVPEEISKQIQKVVSEAENKSAHTCEYCGSKEAKQRGQRPSGDPRWIKTLCTPCWESDD